MSNFIKNDFNLKDLKELSKDYNYIVKANDKFLSGWGEAKNKKHIQLILCKTIEEKERIFNDLQKDNTFNYVNWYPLSESWFNNILQLKYKYSVSLRNDWSR